MNAYSKLVEDARDRALWRECVDKIVNDQRAIYESKVQRKAERRQEAKRKREADTLERATSGSFSILLYMKLTSFPLFISLLSVFYCVGS